jgi:hypothetical protein
MLGNLPPEALAFQSRVLLRFDPSEVVRVNVTRNRQSQTYIRPGAADSWVSDGAPPDPVALHALLSFAARLRVDELLEEIPAVFTAAEPDPDLIRISFGLSGADAANRTLLLLREASGNWLGWILGQDTAFRLSGQAAELLTTPLSRPLPPESEVHESAPDPTDV